MDVLIISGGLVVNAIVADSVARAAGFFPGCTVMERTPALASVGPGWTWDGATFHAPAPAAPVVPESVTPRQIRQAMTALGMRAQVEQAVAASSQDVKDWWEFASEFRRDHPMIAAMAAGLGKTPADIDGLFQLAGSL